MQGTKREAVAGKTTNRIAFLASGKLFLCADNSDPVEYASPFIEKIETNRARDAQNSGWQQNSSSWSLSCNTPSALGQPGVCGTNYRPPMFRTLTKVQDGFAYLIETESVFALLNLDINDSTEYRLKHAHSAFAHSIAQSPNQRWNAMSVSDENGARHIAVTQNGFSNPEPITVGDVVDDAPSFHPSDDDVLVYHSAGIGRNNDGQAYGLGPSSVHMLNLDTDELLTCAEHDGFDYLAPKLASDGSLYCLRRPWQLARPRSLRQNIIDAALVPVRLVQLVVIAAHHLSLMISNKPILPGLNDPSRAQANPSVMLWNRWMTQQNARKKRFADDAIVPDDWTLVRIENPSSNSAETEIARHVAAFDIDNHNRVVYTNGSKIWRIDEQEAKPIKIASGSLIESVCAQ